MAELVKGPLYGNQSQHQTRMLECQGARLLTLQDATLHRVELPLPDGSLLPIVPGTQPEWAPGMWNHGIVMIGWAGKVPQGEYTHNGTLYKLPTDHIDDQDTGFAMHGVTRSRDFTVINKEYQTLIYEGEVSGYPFSFATQVVDTLRNNGFNRRIAVTNLGEEPIPMVVGTHIYYALGVPLDQLELYVQGQGGRRLDENGQLSGRCEGTFRLSAPLKDKLLDHYFEVGDSTNPPGHLFLTAVLHAASKGLTLLLRQNSPGLVVYTHPERENGEIALETMSGPPGLVEGKTPLLAPYSKLVVESDAELICS